MNEHHPAIGCLVLRHNSPAGRIQSVNLDYGVITLRDATKTREWTIEIPGIAPVHNRDWRRVHNLINEWINHGTEEE